MNNNEDLTKTNEAGLGATASDEQQTDAPNSTPDPLETLNHKLKEAEQKYVYLYAEFDNYKKRAVKERQDIVKFGWENVASDLLLVLDNFERALQ
jgi:molecular chaperone GrpE